MKLDELIKKIRVRYPEAAVYRYDPMAWSADPESDMCWIEDGHDNVLSDSFFHSENAWRDLGRRLGIE
jgi:hypothetical protein